MQAVEYLQQFRVICDHLNLKCLTSIIVFDIGACQFNNIANKNTPNANSQHTNISHELCKHKMQYFPSKLSRNHALL